MWRLQVCDKVIGYRLDAENSGDLQGFEGVLSQDSDSCYLQGWKLVFWPRQSSVIAVITGNSGCSSYKTVTFLHLLSQTSPCDLLAPAGVKGCPGCTQAEPVHSVDCCFNPQPSYLELSPRFD